MNNIICKFLYIFITFNILFTLNCTTDISDGTTDGYYVEIFAVCSTSVVDGVAFPIHYDFFNVGFEYISQTRTLFLDSTISDSSKLYVGTISRYTGLTTGEGQGLISCDSLNYSYKGTFRKDSKKLSVATIKINKISEICSLFIEDSTYILHKNDSCTLKIVQLDTLHGGTGSIMSIQKCTIADNFHFYGMVRTKHF